MSFSYHHIKIIVPGGLNTDIIGLGVRELLGPGELTLGGELHIGPGGKSRNIAQMAAAFAGRGRVAMIGRSSKDPYGLWKPPVRALIKAGVNTDFIKISDFRKTKKYPGIALIPVNRQGENQIYVLPGVNADFSAGDIDDAGALFAGGQSKILALSLEIPLAAAVHAVKKAVRNNIKVVLDPGGIDRNADYSGLLKQKIFLIKPNEHEAGILTGVKVSDFKTAGMAARRLFRKGIQNVMITHGKHGAYLFTGSTAFRLPVPRIRLRGRSDATGCGDQVMAVLCAELSAGRTLPEAARAAILAGTLQFYRVGIQPVSRKEIARYLK